MVSSSLWFDWDQSGTGRPFTQQGADVDSVDDAVAVQVTQWWVRQAPERQDDRDIRTSDAPIEVEVAFGQLAHVGNHVVIDVIYRAIDDVTVIGDAVVIAVRLTSVGHLAVIGNAVAGAVDGLTTREFVGVRLAVTVAVRVAGIGKTILIKVSAAVRQDAVATIVDESIGYLIDLRR